MNAAIDGGILAALDVIPCAVADLSRCFPSSFERRLLISCKFEPRVYGLMRPGHINVASFLLCKHFG